jgi:uncharacterized membrane protein YgdD (TMEM256/DUF423 family)
VRFQICEAPIVVAIAMSETKAVCYHCCTIAVLLAVGFCEFAGSRLEVSSSRPLVLQRASTRWGRECGLCFCAEE